MTEIPNLKKSKTSTNMHFTLPSILISTLLYIFTVNAGLGYRLFIFNLQQELCGCERIQPNKEKGGGSSELKAILPEYFML